MSGSNIAVVAALAVVAGFVGIRSVLVPDSADWNVGDTGQPFYEAEFRVDEGTWMSVDVSPDGKTLLFDLLGDIYQLPADGGEARLIHGGPAMQRMPAYSPDGARIVYVSDEGGSDNLWVSDSDGGNARQISTETVDVLTSPDWTESGEYIVAARYDAAFANMRSSEIRLFHVDGGDGHLLVATPSNGRDVNEPRLSGDGRFLFYSERIADTHIYVDANHKNFVIKQLDLNSGDHTTLVGGFGGAISPQVSPNGRHLAFIRRLRDKSVLFRYDRHSGEQVPVYAGLERDLQGDFVPHGAYYPRYDWFPDNRHVAVWAGGELLRVDMIGGEVEKIPFSVTSRHSYTEVPEVDIELAPKHVSVKAIRDITVSPDGGDLVFSAAGALWKSSATGETVKKIAGDDASFAAEPQYSPDGNRLAYVSWEDGKGSTLNLVGADGARRESIAASGGLIREPAFAPKGDKIAYWIGAPDKSRGGYGAKPGLYWVSLVDDSRGYIDVTARAPRFSADGERIYFSRVAASNDTGSLYAGVQHITQLESSRLDGTQRRTHARSADTDTHEFSLSPDGRWLAFANYRHYYLMPYRDAGKPVIVSTEAAVPVGRLTETSGHSLAWASDSAGVYWMRGNTLHRHDPVEVFAAAGEFKPSAETRRIELTLAADIPAGALALVGGRIITMRAEEVIDNGVLVVTGNRITALGPVGETDIPEGAKRIDVSGKTLMPGLVDMHGHIDCCGDGGVPPQKQPLRYAALAFGVTTNYDPYSTELSNYESAEMQLAGRIVSPRWLGAGKGVFGRRATPDNSFYPIGDYGDAQRIIAEKAALGGAILKSYRQPMRSQRQQLVKAGREYGILVDAEGENHFYNNLTMMLDGHMALEHNIPVANYYADLVQFMAHSETANTPTLITLFGEVMGENYMYQKTRAWEDPKVRAYIQETNSSYSPVNAPPAAPPHVRGMTTLHAAEDIWDAGFRSVARSINALDAAGVTINAGSHGQIAGLGLHWEMWLLAEGGMEPHRVLRTATVNGARTLGVDDQIGTLEVGRLADLIVLDDNPLDDIRNTNSVRYTMLNGRLYDAHSLDEIGNYDVPRTPFYWELQQYNGVDWNQAWAN